eukprot:UN31721
MLFKLALLCVVVFGRMESPKMAMWNQFKTDYGRSYASPEEEQKRMEIFHSNVVLAKQRQADDMGTAEHGVTKFMDLTPNEFSAMFLGYNSTITSSPLPSWNGDCISCSRQPDMKTVPKSVDWTTMGAVTPVKDQAQCGSCWTFSTTGGLEGAWYMGGNDLVALSEQEIVSCDKDDGNQGCQGGEMTTAYQWVMRNGGIDSEKDYPYTSGTGSTGTCKKTKLSNVVAKISGAVYISSSVMKDVDENRCVNATAQIGPLSVAVNATPFQTYRRGILNPRRCSKLRLDHGVLIVGYGTSKGQDYWKVKNSVGRKLG